MDDTPKRHKAAENPLAAALLGAILVKHGRRDNDRAMEQAGMELVEIAKQNQPAQPAQPAPPPPKQE